MRTRDEEKLASIKSKAIEMIVKEGFDGFSMKKLAKAADISPSTIYIYFLNKEDLINKLFSEIAAEQSDAILRDFDAEMGFADGLLIQWQNRYEYAINYPIHYRFFEQFRSSPLIAKVDQEVFKEFRTIMDSFFSKRRDEIALPDLPHEMIWALIFGPLYSIISFSLSKRKFNEDKRDVTNETLKAAFDVMIKPFRK